MDVALARASGVPASAVSWSASPPAWGTFKQVVVVGGRDAVQAAVAADGPVGSAAGLPAPDAALLVAAAGAMTAGADAPSSTTFVLASGDMRVTLAALPTAVSRHNSPALPHAITTAVRGAVKRGGGPALVVAILPSSTYEMAGGAAVARAFPAFTTKTTVTTEPAAVTVHLHTLDGSAVNYELVKPVADGARFAGALVDMPTSVLHTDEFVAIARDVASEVGATIDVLQRDTLPAEFGGLWGVGKAAAHPPALVVLKYDPSGFASGTAKRRAPDAGAGAGAGAGGGGGRQTICMVGKGIVYDTGGLSIKGKTFMPGMKRDMGGAAAILAAFRAIALTKCTDNVVYAVLCLAENSVGPDSTRPDDILHMYSGKTVEVNNTDAEGRLVVGDGVAYCEKHLSPTVIMDMCTLTGAQGISTGKRHGALYTNSEAMETLAVACGKECGDLAFPLVYCPEFFRKEFASAVADMKNSVRDRANAQSSCAGQFIGNQLGAFLDTGRWLHIDMAYPAFEGEVGTGYGVALLTHLVQRLE